MYLYANSLFIFYSFTLSNTSVAECIAFPLGEGGCQDTFLPSTCGSEQNEASQKQPRSAVAAVSKGVLFAFLPVHSFCL